LSDLILEKVERAAKFFIKEPAVTPSEILAAYVGRFNENLTVVLLRADTVFKHFHCLRVHHFGAFSDMLPNYVHLVYKDRAFSLENKTI